MSTSENRFADAELAQSIGTACRQARARLLLTQRKVAASIGVSIEFYGRIEHGRALPRVTTLAALIDLLGLDANALFGVEDGRSGPAAERPQLQRLLPALRRASAGALRCVAAVLRAFEEAGQPSRSRR